MEHTIGIINEIARQAKDGETDALKCFTQIRNIEKAAEEAKEIILSLALDQFRKYGKKEVELYGFKISETGGGKYDYKDIPEWITAKEKISEIEQKAQLAFKSNELVDGIMPACYCPNKSSLKFEKVK